MGKCRCPENEVIYNEIMEWKKSILKQRRNGRGGGRSRHFAFALKKAATSIALYPLPIKTRKDAEELSGVGPTISARIMRSLEKNNGTLDETKRNKKKKVDPSSDEIVNDEALPVPPRKRGKIRRTSSMPASFRPSNHHLGTKTMTTTTLTIGAGKSRTLKRRGSCHGIVSRDDRKELRQTTLSPLIRRRTLLRDPKPYPLRDGEKWDVILLLDNREVRSRRDRNYFEAELLEANVQVETRQLPLGDILWVARPKHIRTSDPSREYVLGFIVERKKTSDLASSIIDKRYASQKYRLKQCGLHRLIYLVEGRMGAQELLPAESLRMALLKTSAIDGFQVQETKSAEESVRWMRQMQEKISNLVMSGVNAGAFCDPLMTYEAWKAKVATRKTVTNTFGEMLMQVKGCSNAKVEAILKRFPTPYRLISEMRRLEGGRTAGIALLQDLRPPNQSKRLGPTLAESIYDLAMSL